MPIYKKINPSDAITQIKQSNAIDFFLTHNKPIEALYLVGLVNYLSNKYHLNMNIHDYDNYKLKNMVYPRSILFQCAVMNDENIKKEAIAGAEKEFLQFNICEGEIERVL